MEHEYFIRCTFEVDSSYGQRMEDSNIVTAVSGMEAVKRLKAFYEQEVGKLLAFDVLAMNKL